MNTRVEGNRVSIVIHSLVFTLHCVNGNFFSIVTHSLMFSSTLCQRELFQYCHPLLDVHTYIVSKGTVSVLSSTPWSSHLHCVKWNCVCIVIHSLEFTFTLCQMEPCLYCHPLLGAHTFTLCQREPCQYCHPPPGVRIYIV